MNDADKRIEWKARYDAWEASGLSAAEWCRNEKVNKHRMYYWIRKFREDTASKHEPKSGTKWLAVNMQGAPAVHSDDESVLIHVGTLSVEVRPGTDMELLSHVVHVLQNQ
jgi:hypothetical protein